MSTKTLTAAMLSNIGVSLLTLLLALPVIPVIERWAFPVVTSMTFESVETAEGGDLVTYVAFEKLRSCEFIALSFIQNGDRIRVDFPPEDLDLPLSRPEGEYVTGPWVLNTTSLEGLRVVVEHRCHFLWNTFTDLYP